MDTWHNFIFKMHWPQNQPPNWWIDLFIVDTIIKTIISDYRDQIRLWRFHRRAGNDQLGHQLTLFCYTNEKIGLLINDVIKGSMSYNILTNHQVLEKYLYQKGGHNIEDSSDKSWPIEIQKSWPYFIFGVSAMLLELIDMIGQNVANKLHLIPPFTNITEIEKFYSSLNENLKAIWQQNGSHAFFHHINALFGYAPVLAQPREIFGVGILASF